MNQDRPSRARVLKACDNCRLRKAKCDGTQPCSRCEAHDTICVFGERKMPPKNHPRGYVEMLEQQQCWLIKGLREMYRRAIQGKSWPGEPLRQEADGHPLIHDILFRLGALNEAEEHEKNHSDDTVDMSYEEKAPAQFSSQLPGWGYPYHASPSFTPSQLAETSRQMLCLSPTYFESTQSKVRQSKPNLGHMSASATSFPTSPLSILDGINLITTDDYDQHLFNELGPLDEVEFAKFDSINPDSHLHPPWPTSTPNASSCNSSISPRAIEINDTEGSVNNLWSMFSLVPD